LFENEAVTESLLRILHCAAHNNSADQRAQAGLAGPSGAG
jgi:hypothetical protein